MKRFEKILSTLILGGTFPLLLGLLSVILWFYFDNSESRVVYYLSAGFLTGILIDLRFLKGWYECRFTLPIWQIAGIFIFYNICVFGFFMGFPVFNLLLGIVAGFYFGKRISHNNIPVETQHMLIRRVPLFTGFIMTLICLSSAIIGLTDKYIGRNIQGMFGLDIEITHTMIISIIIAGGFSLILMQYFITKMAMMRMLNPNH